MTENKKTTTPETVAGTAVQDAITINYLVHDVRTSVLIVSILANLIVFITWIAIQVTTAYDAQLVGFLFNR